jgi:hypothetical protein
VASLLKNRPRRHARPRTNAGYDDDNETTDQLIRRSQLLIKTPEEPQWLFRGGNNVIPAKAGIVRLKAHLVREVEVLFRYALSGL